jgi:hypothetical protein
MICQYRRTWAVTVNTRMSFPIPGSHTRGRVVTATFTFGALGQAQAQHARAGMAHLRPRERRDCVLAPRAPRDGGEGDDELVGHRALDGGESPGLPRHTDKVMRGDGAAGRSATQTTVLHSRACVSVACVCVGGGGGSSVGTMGGCGQHEQPLRSAIRFPTACHPSNGAWRTAPRYHPHACNTACWVSALAMRA